MFITFTGVSLTNKTYEMSDNPVHKDYYYKYGEIYVVNGSGAVTYTTITNEHVRYDPYFYKVGRD